MKRCQKCAHIFEADTWVCAGCGMAPRSIAGFPAFAPEFAEKGPGFRPEAYAELASLEAGNFWFRARNDLILWAIHRHFPRMRRYLEIGCGTGFVLGAIVEAHPDVKATGSEVFSAGLPYAASRVKNTELLQMDALRIPFVDEFDVIGAFDVLEHIEADETVLGEMLRAVRPGGGIIVTVPQHPWLWSYQDELACHVRRYRKGELRKKITAAGFRVELDTSFVSLLLPAMFGSRLLRKTASKGGDDLTELRLPAVVNWFFEMVMSIERHLIRFGARFPAGGSELLIATKSRDDE